MMEDEFRNEMHSSDNTGTNDESTRSMISEFDPSSRLMKEFNILGHIGSGAFANVYQVRNKLDSSLYAIKRIKLNLDENDQLDKKITKEVELLSKLNHQNVVRYYNSWLEDFESQWENDSIYQTNDSITDDDEEIENDDSNSIVFQHSEMKSENMNSFKNNSINYTHMCIQMEYCEQSTLRNVIDDNLYQDQDRVWRLIGQSVGGLAYIHDEGIIHRDLKPDNIFIDGNGRVKIGDFGLATLIDSTLQDDTKSSHTGDVGTPLYDAPELKSSGKKVRYDQKIDMYSLGIIFFEMCYPPFQTAMEKKKVLSNLRKSPAKVAQYINPSVSKKRDPSSQDLYYSKENQSKLICELLDHDPEKRPSASEILKNGFLLDKMYRLSIALPKNTNSSFERKISTSRLGYLNDFDFHDDSLWKANVMEMLSDEARGIFRLHGGIFYPCRLPLDWIEGRKISIVKSFAGCLLANPRITHIKRYTFNELSESFRSKSFNSPFQCATFDIVSSISTNLAMEIEVLLIVCEFLERFSGRIPMNDFVIRLSHGSLTPRVRKHIQEHLGIGTDHPILLEEFISYTCIRDMDIEEWKLIENKQVEKDSSLSSHILHLILQDEGLSDIDRKSIDELKRLVDVLKSLDIKCPVVIAPSLMNNYEYSNIMFQIVHKDYISYGGSESGVVAVGRRYDKLIAEPKHLSAVYLTIYLDRFAEILKPETKFSKVEVLVCSCDPEKLLKEKLKLSKELWAAEIRSSISYVEHKNLEEIEEYCNEMKIPYILFLEETEEVKVFLCSFTHDGFQKKDFALWEVAPYLKNIIKGNSGSAYIPSVMFCCEYY